MAEIGETIVHELVIHGWRAVQESDDKTMSSSLQPSPINAKAERFLKWKAIYDYIWGGHTHGAHTGPSLLHGPRGSREHSLADIEADLLHYYFRNVAPEREADGVRPHEDKEFKRLIEAIGGKTLTCETYCKAEGRKILGHSSSIPAKFRYHNGK